MTPRPMLVAPGGRVHVSSHGKQRLAERSQLTTSQILQLWREGRTAQLGDPKRNKQHRAYQLLWSVADQAHFVAVMSEDRVLITLLTREQFEASNWPISHGALKRAAWLVLSESRYADWLANFEIAEGPEPEATSEKQDPLAGRSIRILLEYWDESFTLNTLRLGTVPIEHACHLDDIGQVAAQSWFWDWFAERLAKKGGLEALPRAEALYALRGGNLVQLSLA